MVSHELYNYSYIYITNPFYKTDIKRFKYNSQDKMEEDNQNTFFIKIGQWVNEIRGVLKSFYRKVSIELIVLNMFVLFLANKTNEVLVNY